MQKSLPSSYYLAEEIFALEKERIFCREWFCAAREEQVANAGDFLCWMLPAKASSSCAQKRET